MWVIVGSPDSEGCSGVYCQCGLLRAILAVRVIVWYTVRVGYCGVFWQRGLLLVILSVQIIVRSPSNEV